MRLDVELALVLVGADVFAVVGRAFDHALDDAARALRREQRAQLVLDLDQLGAQEAQQRFLFLRSPVRHCNFYRRTAGIGHGSQRDAGIARRRLNERLAVAQPQAPQHVQGRAVLDRTERVHALELDEHLVIGVRVDALAQAHHWRRVVRVRGEVDDTVEHAISALFSSTLLQEFDGGTHDPKSMSAAAVGNARLRLCCYGLITDGYKHSWSASP